MKRLAVTGCGIFLTASVVVAALWIVPGCMKDQPDPFSSVTPATLAKSPVTPSFIMGTGNGAPKGPHYNLNIIGVPKNKSADMTDSDGHVIFVPLTGNTRILLSLGPFNVLDANGTDGEAAFQLPAPDPLNIGTTTYSVWARALGKPGGQASVNTCATDELGTLYCSVNTLRFVRAKGKGSFVNVTKDLLYIYADINTDGIPEQVPLFDARLQDYFWAYDNTGLKLVQLRFYPISTAVATVQ